MRRFRAVQLIALVGIASTLSACAAWGRLTSAQSTPPAALASNETPSASATPTPSETPMASSSSQPVESQPPVPVAPPAQPVPAVRTPDPNWTAHVYFTQPPYRVVVTILDSRGIHELGNYDLVLTMMSNPPRCCFIGPSPAPSPTSSPIVQHFAGCCTPEYLQVNLIWGGTWAVTGSVSFYGRTERVSASGTVPATANG